MFVLCIGGENFERRGGDDWGSRGAPRGRDGDPALRQNDRWQEPDKRGGDNTQFGGKWKEGGRGGGNKGKIILKYL